MGRPLVMNVRSSLDVPATPLRRQATAMVCADQSGLVGTRATVALIKTNNQPAKPERTPRRDRALHFWSPRAPRIAPRVVQSLQWGRVAKGEDLGIIDCTDSIIAAEMQRTKSMDAAGLTPPKPTSARSASFEISPNRVSQRM